MLKSNNFLKYFLLVGFLAGFTPVPSFADWIPLRLVVDNLQISDVETFLDENGKAISVNSTQLIRVLEPFVQSDKIQRITALSTPEGAITLENLSRIGITPTYNENELKLNLNIPLEMRAIKDYPVLLAQSQTGLGLYSDKYSGYLNVFGLVGYSAQTSPLTSSETKNPAEGQVELVQNLNFATFETTARYKEFDPKPFERLDTSLVHDFEKDQNRLRLGDHFTGIQGFQSSMPAAGIQFQKQFNIYPDKGAINKRSTTINVKANATMEVFVNGNLILRSRVAAGPYNLKDLPLLYGQNKVRIVLTDDYGGKEEFNVNLLFDDQILAKGVSDFSYQAGLPSYFVGNEKKYYDDGFASVFHKYGLNDEVNLLANYQTYQTSNLYGLGVGFLSAYGTSFIDVAYYADSIVDAAHGASWRYSSPEFNLPNFEQFRFLGSAEFRSKDFNTITATGPSIPNFLEKYDVVFQKQLTDVSSMSIGVTNLIGQNFGNNELSYRMVYQTQLSKVWRFDFSYSRNEQVQDSAQVLLTLNWLDTEGKAQAALAHDTANNGSSVRMTRNSQFNYNDFQMSMFADKQKSRVTGIESQNANISANYYATKYEIRGQIDESSSLGNLNTTTQVGFGSALAWTSDSLSISRPITDAFAVIQADGMATKQKLTIPNGLEKDSIYLKNKEAFVFSNLTSYVDRTLRLDSTGLGASSHLDREAYILRPKYRSGMFVPLKVIKSLSLRGRLVAEDKEMTSYVYGRILTEDGKVFSNNFFTDESGNFVLDGLNYGKYQIELADSRFKKISFELVDIGETARAEQADEAEDSDASEYELGTLKLEKETGM